MRYALLAIDQGTTSTRAILFSEKGEPFFIRQKELVLQYPQKGWVEQDPETIWQDTLWVCQNVLKDTQHYAITIAGIGITNQRETTLIWDRTTGKTLYNAIVWQDRRTVEACSKLINAGYSKTIAEKTGLLIDPYFSATKIAWILDHVPGARVRAQNGDLAFGTVDTFLLWRLTGGKVHATDVTNASRTLLYNITTNQWDDELLALFDIPSAILPEVKANVADYGQTTPNLFGVSYTIGGMAGDQHAALIGQSCFEPGMIKATYGTGCFALMNIGTDFVISKNKLLTTVGYRIGNETHYALEGSIFTAGAVIQWLRDNLGLLVDAKQSESIARSVSDSNEVYFVPAFTGLGAPYWKPFARAAITGLSRESHKAHIVRAALEAQGYQSRDLIEAMMTDSGIRNMDSSNGVLRVDGGMVVNAFVCQFIADMINQTVEIPAVSESTAWGAAVLAGLQSNVYENLSEISSNWTCSHRYKPSMDAIERDALYAGWKNAVLSVVR
ncbi:MAG: glycerol kinase GlpK [Nitrosomonas sp.]|nr:glycerol kinase GlpK [Nitrosomonas sp.]